jgi:hypothetical protein
MTQQPFTREFRDDAVRVVFEKGYSCEETGFGVHGTAAATSTGPRMEAPPESQLTRSHF